MALTDLSQFERENAQARHRTPRSPTEASPKVDGLFSFYGPDPPLDVAGVSSTLLTTKNADRSSLTIRFEPQTTRVTSRILLTLGKKRVASKLTRLRLVAGDWYPSLKSYHRN